MGQGLLGNRTVVSESVGEPLQTIAMEKTHRLLTGKVCDWEHHKYNQCNDSHCPFEPEKTPLMMFVDAD